jgi:antirestriction protein ArdC
MRKPSTTQRDDAKAKAEDVRTALVASMIEAIQSDPLHWSKSWTCTCTADGLPFNGATGKRYRGGNVFWFMVAAIQQGYTSSAWGTVRQWNEVGCRVRKGQHGTLGLFWKQWKRTETVMTPDGPTKVDRTLPVLRTFSVFNFDQVDIIDEDKFSRSKVKPREIPPAVTYPGEHVLSAVPFAEVYGNPAYSRTADVVWMPHPTEFDTLEQYATTLAHELTHWTGHPDRLDRPSHTRWGDDAYAFEELVAELGAAMMAAHIGVDHVTRQDHVAYLQSWVSKLGDDPQALWSAATKASDAFERLLSYSETVDVIDEPTVADEQPEPETATADDGQLVMA